MQSYYCESYDGFLLEPINTLTNLAFFISAVLLLRLKSKHYSTNIMSVLVFCIGLGSTIWHATQTGIGLAMDSGFIAILIVYYLWCYTRYIMHYKTAIAFLVIATTFAGIVMIGSLQPFGRWGQGLGYLSPLIVIVLIGWQRFQKGYLYEAKTLWLGMGIFVLSLMFRSLDSWACAYVPVGTHPLWHLLNATVLYILIVSYNRSVQALTVKF